MIDSKLVSTAVFGSFDGMTSAMGVILPLLATPHALLLGALGIGIAAIIGMGLGEWQSDSSSGWRAPLVMAVASGAGVLIPVIPFLFITGWPAVAISAAIIVAATGFIAKVRATNGKSYWKAARESFTILGITALAVWLGTKL
jgi:VIT1/CCC1 family predicted Fe2+/Mn2+ transporter